MQNLLTSIDEGKSIIDIAAEEGVSLETPRIEKR